MITSLICVLAQQIGLALYGEGNSATYTVRWLSKSAERPVRFVFTAILLTIAVGCHKPALSVPALNGEPASPVEVLEAGGLLDGGTMLAGLRDREGTEYWFTITPLEFEDADRRLAPNRLYLFHWGEAGSWEGNARLVELGSLEEARIRKAVDLALSTFPKHLADESRELTLRRDFLHLIRKRLDTLGKEGPDVDENIKLERGVGSSATALIRGFAIECKSTD